MNQFNMSNMEIEEFCEALVLDYIRKYNAPTDGLCRYICRRRHNGNFC